MPSRFSAERGFTLIELLIASTLMIIVLSATLNSLDVFSTTSSANTKTNDQQDQLRFGVDRLTKQLRNMANPTNGTLQTLLYADSYKLVFQTTDPTRQWVMYCLDSSGVLWYEATSGVSGAGNGAPGSSTSSVCKDPAAGWATQRKISTNITNGSSRPVFTYETINGALPTGAVASTDLTKIIRVTIDLFLDLNPNKPPPELELQSGIHLRNQFAPPTAQFTAQSTGPSTWLFDGSNSTNPQGSTAAPYLNYAWYMESGTPSVLPSGSSSPTLSALPDCTAFPAPSFQLTGDSSTTWTCLGVGLQLSYNFAGQSLPHPVNIWLRTTNSGKLSAFSALPATGCEVADPGNSPRTNDSACLSVDFVP